PDLMKVHINSTSLCFDLAYCLYAEIDFGVHMIDTQWVGLGLWGRCVSYVLENCVSYASQQTIMVEWTDALARSLIVYPWTQRYFGSFGSLSDAATIMANKKVARLNNNSHGLFTKKNHKPLSNCAFGIACYRQYVLLGDCVTIVVASQLGRAFTPDIQAAWQKFLAVVVSALGKQYH
uniref:Globin domain-containing protein n=1 Tax=Sinocyclocheilus grahami TaxID=75366 RepID=A0A672MF62_SINGR